MFSKNLHKFLLAILVAAQLVLPVSGYAKSVLQGQAGENSMQMKSDCHQQNKATATKHSCCDSQDLVQPNCNNQCDSCNVAGVSYVYAQAQFDTGAIHVGASGYQPSEVLIPPGKLPSLLHRPPQ